jgi:hypothetical protein
MDSNGNRRWQGRQSFRSLAAAHVCASHAALELKKSGKSDLAAFCMSVMIAKF